MDKDSLDARLSEEGFKFLRNVSVADHELAQGFPGINGTGNRTEIIPHSSKVRDEYQKLYSKVRLEQAYDSSGKELNSGNHVAVYVKK
ncbi:MAG: hypothetical protein AABW52_05095 [Nanoarchaeota archaeon]